MINKLAIVSTDFPREGHPSYVFVEQLVNALVDLGVDVSVIAPQSITKNLVRHIPMMPKSETYRTNQGHSYNVYRPYYISFGNCNAVLQKYVDYFRIKAITSILDRIQYDAIYTHFWENAMLVYKYAMQKNMPFFVACGEGDEALEELNKKLTNSQRSELRNTVSGVISVSSENKRKCIKYGIVDNDRIEVLPNCVNTELFRPQDASQLKTSLGIASEDFTIAFVGSFIHRKGATRVSEAIKQLNDPNIKSIFIGRPFANDNCQPECDGIVFKGSLDHDDIPAYLNCADVFVLPTLKEGCCNAIVEALSTGLPVISSDGSFNDDIIDSANSIRVDPMDVDAIAAAIKKMKEDKAFVESLRRNINETRSQYSIIGRAKRILEFINAKK